MTEYVTTEETILNKTAKKRCQNMGDFIYERELKTVHKFITC